MTQKQKGTPHYSATNEARKRKKHVFTLSDQAKEKLEALAAKRGKNMSQIVEDLIMAAR